MLSRHYFRIIGSVALSAIVLSCAVQAMDLFMPLKAAASDVDRRVEALMNRSKQYARRQEYGPALALINQAIEIKPREPELIYQRAFILGKSGQYEHAIKDFNRAIQTRQYPHAIRFRADCYMAVGYYPQAAKDYYAFLKLAPKDGKVWSYLVEVLATMGETRQALIAVQKGLATGSHWSKRLETLRNQIFSGQKVSLHKPLSN